MKFLNKLFGKGKDTDKTSDERELQARYNVMDEITLSYCSKYAEAAIYKKVEDGIYEEVQDGDDARYRMTLSFRLDPETINDQYPLEDILDKYLLYVSDFLEQENEIGSNRYKRELGGTLDKVKEVKEIIGKTVFNQDFKDEDGQVRVRLVIE